MSSTGIKNWSNTRSDNKLPIIKKIFGVEKDSQLIKATFNLYKTKYSKEPPIDIQNFNSTLSKYANATNIPFSSTHKWFFEAIFDKCKLNKPFNKVNFEKFKSCNRTEFINSLPPNIQSKIKKKWMHFSNTSVILHSDYLNFNYNFKDWIKNQAINQNTMYQSVEAANKWENVLAGGNKNSPKTQKDCINSLYKLLDSKEWNEEISEHLIDRVVFLGGGGLLKEKKIIETLVNSRVSSHLSVWYVDTSLPMLKKGIDNISSLNYKIKNKLHDTLYLLCDFMDLPKHSDWFEKFPSRRTAYFILGGTFGNVPENLFLGAMYKLMKSRDDLLIINVDTFTEQERQEFTQKKLKEYKLNDEILSLVTTPIRESKTPPLDPVKDIEELVSPDIIQYNDPDSFCDVRKSFSIQFRWAHPQQTGNNPISLSVSKKYEHEKLIDHIYERGFKIIQPNNVKHHLVCKSRG